MISRKERRDHKGFSNVASVIVLPLPMLPVSNWELEIDRNYPTRRARHTCPTAKALREALNPPQPKRKAPRQR